MEDQKLIKSCIKGSRKAQKAFYQKFASKLYVIALRYCKTNFEAEDVLQESFIKIFTHLHTFKGEGNVYFWMKRIVINTALKNHRSAMYRAPKDDITELYNPPSEEFTISNYNFKELLTFIQRLAPSYQTIFNLYAIEGYKHREIAEMLQISEGTSKSQYARAKKNLQKMLEKENSRLINSKNNHSH